MQLRQKSNRPSRRRSKRNVKSAPIRWEAPRFETLLARADNQLQCSYLQEPMLSFAGKQQCEDPRTGLTAYGPYSRTEPSRRNLIRVGIVGPADAIDRTVSFLSQLSQRIEPSGRYDDQIGGLPRKVVLHKTSRFTEEERKGYEAALEGVSHYGLLTITRRGIFCLRPGKKAALRGTVIDFGQKRGLVYTMGYVPFLRCYPGFRVPQPLEISENWGSVSLQEAAQDLLKLTKLNWNTAAFNCRDPITIAFSRRVGDILKMAKGKDPALHYRYYM